MQGYKSAGHNSAFIDTDNQRYLVYHTRFDSGNESHEVRVHQQFLNQDNWPVTAVYEYLGSTISKTGYSASDMLGEYEFVNHGKDASTKKCRNAHNTENKIKFQRKNHRGCDGKLELY